MSNSFEQQVEQWISIAKGGEGSGVRGHVTAEPPRQSDPGRNQADPGRNRVGDPSSPRAQKQAFASVVDRFKSVVRQQNDPKDVTDIWGLADH